MKNIVTIILLLCIYHVNAQETDSLEIRYNYINTVPQNANIYMNGNFIGQSPLYFMIDSSVTKRKFTISLPSFFDFEYTPESNEVLINKSFNLIPVKGRNVKETVFKDKSFAFEKPLKLVPVIISTAVTAVSAIMAYYFKSLAIKKNDDYDITGDPAILDKKKKYDIIGGVSIVVFQAGLFSLIYFHFIDN